MKLKKVLFGMMFTASAVSALAVAKAPVIDVNANAIDSAALTEQLNTLSRKLDSRNKAQVNIQRQLDSLHTEVNELRGVTELHSHQLSEVLARQREIYQEIDRRVNEVIELTAKTPPSASNINTGVSVVADSSVSTTSYSDNLTENESYDRALNLVLKDKSYKQAIIEFEAFNKSFPDSSYAPNAHYWLGQLLFNQGELDQANQAFDVVVTKHKASTKRPDALLKLAMIAQKQNNSQKAITIYQQLLKEYPDSTAGKLAKPRLSSLTN